MIARLLAERRRGRMDDATLLRQALVDRDAFALFYRQHAVALQKWFAYHVERDGQVVLELTAETFAEAIRSLERFRGTEPGSGTAWLFGIARNLAREHHRTQRVRDSARRELGVQPVAAVDWELESVDERVDRSRLAVELERAIAELPPAQRQAIRMRVIDELDYEEIAVATSSSQQSVRLRVSRGLAALRAEITPLEEESW